MSNKPMDLRPAPTTAPTKADPKLGRIVMLQLVTIVAIGVVGYRQLAPPMPTSDASNLRQVASKLRAAGALDEAAALYSEYLSQNPDSSSRAEIAYTVGSTYLEVGQVERALRWFYEAETAGSEELRGDIAKKIVHCLERLGRVHAAQAALAGNVEMPTDNTNRPTSDKLVAKIGNKEVFLSDLQRTLDELPPELAKSLSGDANRSKLLQKYVADELLWRKAQKLEYDKKPRVQRQMASMLKHIVVGNFVEQEVLSKIRTDEADLRTFYEANKETYKKDNEQLTFEQARQRVEYEYRMMKTQTAYAELIQQEISASDVQLFLENL